MIILRKLSPPLLVHGSIEMWVTSSASALPAEVAVMPVGDDAAMDTHNAQVIPKTGRAPDDS
eukprot:3998535-Prymnesium_polylepis.1